MRVVVLFILGVLLTVATAQTKDLYISTNGTDSAGCGNALNTSCKTLGFIVNEKTQDSWKVHVQGGINNHNITRDDRPDITLTLVSADTEVLTVTSCTFKKINIQFEGSVQLNAVNYNPTASVTLESCALNNTVLTTAFPLSMTKCTVNGGHISVSGDSNSFTIKESVMYNGQGIEMGDNTTFSATSCTFRDNVHPTRALFYFPRCAVTLTNCVVHNNSAPASSIMWSNGGDEDASFPFKLVSCNLTSNFAANGVIHFDGKTLFDTVTYNEVRVYNNTATETAPIALAPFTSLRKFFEVAYNQGKRGGGVIMETTGSPSVQISAVVSIHDNSAEQGGGISIYNNQGPVFLQQNEGATISIYNNTAKRGGAMYTNYSTRFTIVDPMPTITGNRAQEGGAFYIDAQLELILNTSLYRLPIVGNHANVGGGIWASSNAQFGWMNIVNNTADSLGGGLYRQMNESTNSTVTSLHDLLISGNSAQRGGGVFVEYVSEPVNEGWLSITIRDNTQNQTTQFDTNLPSTPYCAGVIQNGCGSCPNALCSLVGPISDPRCLWSKHCPSKSSCAFLGGEEPVCMCDNGSNSPKCDSKPETVDPSPATISPGPEIAPILIISLLIASVVVVILSFGLKLFMKLRKSKSEFAYAQVDDQ